MQCVDCQEINEYANANQANGSYICYKCRPVKFSDDVVANNKPIKVHVSEGAHVFFYHNYDKIISSFEISFKSANQMTYTVFDSFIIAKVLETYPKAYNAEVRPKIFGLSKDVNLHAFTMIKEKNGIKRVFWASNTSLEGVKTAKQLCEKDIVLAKTLPLNEYMRLPNFEDGKYNYDRY